MFSGQLTAPDRFSYHTGRQPAIKCGLTASWRVKRWLSRLEKSGETLKTMLGLVQNFKHPQLIRYGRCGMKICPAWSAARKTSNINIDGPAEPTFVARTDYHTTYV